MSSKYFRIDIPLDVVEKLAGLGLNWRQISGALSISEDTLKRRRDENPEIEAAFHRGRANTITAVANAVVERALNGDVQAQKLYLNSVAGWTKRVEVETKAPPVLNLILSSGSSALPNNVTDTPSRLGARVSAAIPNQESRQIF